MHIPASPPLLPAPLLPPLLPLLDPLLLPEPLLLPPLDPPLPPVPLLLVDPPSPPSLVATEPLHAATATPATSDMPKKTFAAFMGASTPRTLPPLVHTATGNGSRRRH
jgi:hypothetical protein